MAPKMVGFGRSDIGRVASELYSEFFGTAQSRAATLLTLTSLITAILSVFFSFRPNSATANVVGRTFLIVRDIAVVLLLMTIALYYVYKYVRVKVQLERDIQTHLYVAKQIGYFHVISKEYRKKLFECFFSENIVSTIPNWRTNGKHIIDVKKVCHAVTLALRNSLIGFYASEDFHVAEDIAISLKLFIPSSQLLSNPEYEEHLGADHVRQLREAERVLMTIYRDPTTYSIQSHREVSQNIYVASKNTGFAEIMQHSLDSFTCDDLARLSDANHYFNDTPGWEANYNATMVVPIRYEPSAASETLYFGFLAADSKNPLKYNMFENRKEVQEILSHAADLLSSFFLALSLQQYYDNLDSGPYREAKDA